MARGKSGRVVLEIDPVLKRELYLQLERSQRTLKDWFMAEVKKYLQTAGQMSLFEPNGIVVGSKERSRERNGE